MNTEISVGNSNPIRHLYDSSTLLFLYQLKTDVYGTQIQALHADITNTVTTIFSTQRELEILPAIGPLFLSSILHFIPKQSQIYHYLKTIIQFEPEETLLTTKELISKFDHIIVLIGKKASGKGTVTNLLNDKYGVKGTATSEWLRSIARGRGLQEPYDSVMLRNLGDELREEFGIDVLVWLTLQENYLKGIPNIAFDGLRSVEELYDLIDKPNVSLLWIETSDEKRLQRSNNRKRPGDTQMTMEQLLDIDQRSFSEATILQKKCPFTIINEEDNLQCLEQIVALQMHNLGIYLPKIIG